MSVNCWWKLKHQTETKVDSAAKIHMKHVWIRPVVFAMLLVLVVFCLLARLSYFLRAASVVCNVLFAEYKWREDCNLLSQPGQLDFKLSPIQHVNSA